MRVRHATAVAAAILLVAGIPFVAGVPSMRAQASGAQAAAARRLGFAPERLARIDSCLQQAVDSNRIAGAVGLVLRDGQVAYQRAVGWADKEAGRRMSVESMFRIASQTKAVTSVVILSLMEEGKLALSDPVSRFIPAFARTTVATRADTRRVIRPATRQITIRDLLTHTAGISYGTEDLVAPLYSAKGLGPAAGLGWYTADKNEPVCTTMERLATLPFVAQPGEAWVYGYSTDVLGCVAERASGLALDELIRRRITGPLGLEDTYFFIPLEKRNRLVAVYASDTSNHAVRALDGATGQGHYVAGPRRNFSGGAGLVSTARDYARFLQMVLGGGALGATRILSAHTVMLMTTNQVGALFGTAGVGFGLGFETVDRYGADDLSSVGTFGWGGAYGSQYKVDPKERLIIVFMINQLPNSSDASMKFFTLVYQALVKG
jgi:CubicO group peptidase (beta-lactamase class C family)